MLIGMVIWAILVYISGPIFRTILVIYFIRCWVNQDPANGGWDEDTNAPFGILTKIFPNLRWKYRFACRSNPSFRLMPEYFPMKLIKTVDLPPDRNYMMLYHPHGVICMGANCALSTNCCDFEDVFPGIHRSGVTLKMTFCAPFYRDWLLMMGFIAPNRDLLVKQLTTKEPIRKSIVLLPGGASESMHAHPGVFRLYLSKRKGFIKVAMETGCSIVPCLGFGENEIFDTLYGMKQEYEEPEGKKDSGVWKWVKRSVVRIQNETKRMFTFTFPFVTKIVPNRHPVNVVVGKPIHFEKTLVLDAVEVDKLHAKYCDEVKKLYDQHKAKYGKPNVEIEIL